MAIPFFLALTAAEFAKMSHFPTHIAWMACHFSPYGTGITNLPKTLPEGSLLILNDRTPVCGHDPELICQALWETAREYRCSGLLLDLQRQDSAETAAIIQKVLTLPLPVAVSDLYAGMYDCPVFLSPPPLHIPLEAHTAPWQGREIWLEMTNEGSKIRVTKEGSTLTTIPCPALESNFRDDGLLCHYSTQLTGDAVTFTLFRTQEDTQALIEKAEILGVTHAVGLYQEFGK